MEGKRRSFCEQIRKSTIDDILHMKRKKVMQGMDDQRKPIISDVPDNMSVSTSSEDCVFGILLRFFLNLSSSETA
jgi:hypothetical protein